MFNKNILVPIIAGSTLFTTLANAQEQPTGAETKQPAELIVVLGKVPRPVSDVIGSVTVINSEIIDQQLVHDLADLVRYQPGINIESSGARFGNSGFSIRGIGGNRVTTEIDGIPVADQFAVGSYSNSNRNFVDTDLIKQVEILKGPASST
jgi:hemoglobin/transferrin/lactoferrin receptor protein